jgi:hypothetical protein
MAWSDEKGSGKLREQESASLVKSKGLKIDVSKRTDNPYGGCALAI